MHKDEVRSRLLDKGAEAGLCKGERCRCRDAGLTVYLYHEYNNFVLLELESGYFIVDTIDVLCIRRALIRQRLTSQ